jgi:hypothetical protein
LTTQSCTNAADVTSAIGVYGEYCSSVSSENAGVVQAAATTTVDGGGSGIATQVVVTSKNSNFSSLCCSSDMFL